MKTIKKIGFVAMLIGYAGIAGAIEFDNGMVRSVLLILLGIILMNCELIKEVFIEEKDYSTRTHHFDGSARPYFLR